MEIADAIHIRLNERRSIVFQRCTILDDYITGSFTATIENSALLLIQSLPAIETEAGNVTFLHLEVVDAIVDGVLLII